MNNNNAKRSRNRQTAQSVPDDVYGTMGDISRDNAEANSQNAYVGNTRMDREARESAGTTPPENDLNQMNQTNRANQSNMDADPRQASARALRNSTKNSR
ncbi:MAG TPA: hypothetical protein PKD52_00035 [Clostridiales bacterium]|nr:hypothetical protein [Clostridiales bacterium]